MHEKQMWMHLAQFLGFRQLLVVVQLKWKAIYNVVISKKLIYHIRFEKSVAIILHINIFKFK